MTDKRDSPTHMVVVHRGQKCYIYFDKIFFQLCVYCVGMYWL